MAVLLSDQAGDISTMGYFSLATKHAGAGGDFVFESDIVLAQIPRPQIVGSRRLADGTVELTIAVPAPVAGIELDAACPQNVALGYRLYAKYLRNAFSPFDLRRSEWSPAMGGAGPGGTPIPFGTVATVTLNPWCAGWHHYFAASLVFDGGFETSHVSRPTPAVIGIPEWPDEDCDGVPPFTPDGSLVLDCDDGDPAVYPGAPQICDHQNNDCLHPGWPSTAGTNEDGPDVDGDSWSGSCDNCPDVPNLSQSDENADGLGDACDSNDGLILLGFADRGHVVWQEEAGFTTWNLYRASLQTLRATGVYTQAPGSNPIARIDCGLALPNLSDADAPLHGDVASYLVTGETAGSEGDLGTNSAGQTRPNANPCP